MKRGASLETLKLRGTLSKGSPGYFRKCFDLNRNSNAFRLFRTAFSAEPSAANWQIQLTCCHPLDRTSSSHLQTSTSKSSNEISKRIYTNESSNRMSLLVKSTRLTSSTLRWATQTGAPATLIIRHGSAFRFVEIPCDLSIDICCCDELKSKIEQCKVCPKRLENALSSL